MSAKAFLNPTQERSRTWKRASHRNPCPVCDHTSSKCSFTDDSLEPQIISCHFVDSGVPADGAVPGNSKHVRYNFPRGNGATLADLATRPGATVAVPDVNLKHQVYTNLLASLRLNQRHFKELTDQTGSRRLSLAQLEALGAKSLPSNDLLICKALAAKFGAEKLLTVPGFYRNDRGQIRLNAHDGLLLPSFDGKVLSGLRVKPDKPVSGENGKPIKYWWLSSASKGGPSATLRASVYSPIGEIKEPGTVAITEGEFKARISADILGCTFISTPGTSSWESGGVVELAKELTGPSGKAIIFYDSELNPQTETQRNALADALVHAGLKVAIAEWEPTYKGIDDLLLARQHFTLKPYYPGLPGVPVHRVVNYRYLPDITSQKKVLLLKSPKDTAKTTMVGRKLAGLESTATAISLGHRVLLLEEQAARWQMQFYQEVIGKGKKEKKPDLMLAKRLAICVDSLIHYTKVEPRRLVIIDEVDQVLTHLTANTIKERRRTVWATFKAIINQADQVIAMSADITAKDYRFFERLVGTENIEVVVNEYRHENAAPIMAYASKDELTSDLVNALKEGINTYIPTNSKKEALRLEKLLNKTFPEKRGLCITQYNSADPAIREKIQDLNKSVLGYDWLICSPSLGTGIDINVDHFQETFVFGGHGSTTHSDLLQHVARNRRARLIHAYIATGERNEPTDPAYWREYCIKKAEQTGLTIDYDQAGERIAAPVEADYLALWADIKASEKTSHNQLSANFYKQAEAEGHRVIVAGELEAEELQLIHAARQEASLELKEERIAAILEAPDISETEYQELKDRAFKTPPERAKEERYRIEDHYGLPIDRELVEIDREGRMMSTLLNYMLFTGLIDCEDRDRKQFENTERMLPDARHYTLATDMRTYVLRAAGMLDQNGRMIEKEINTEFLNTVGFVEWATENKAQLYRDLGVTVKSDIAEKPIELLATVLKQIGLKFSYRREGKRGEQLRFYKLDRQSVATMYRLAEARAKRLEEQKNWPELWEIAA